MHFQVFLPNAIGQNPQLLDAVGLADLAEGATFMPVKAGPNGGPGMIVFWRRPGAHASGYIPDRQEWIPAVPSGGLPAARYWVGFWSDSLPLPSDLARARLFSGTAVELGDGNSWVLPVAAMLPRDAILDPETGEVLFEIQERFMAFWKASEPWYARLMGDADGTLTIDRGWFDYVLQAARMNYRLIPEVASQLRLFSTANLYECLSVTVDGMRIALVEDEKKNEEGGKASTPDI